MAEFRMPALGADMEAGTLVAWRKQPGDLLARGDIIAEVETDKGIIEVEVFAPGVIDRLLVPPGTKVLVGTPLALMRDPSSPAALPAAGAPAAPAPVAPAPVTSAPAAPAPAAPAPVAPAPRALASPAARRRAQELGLELGALHGTGPHGTLTLADVEAAASGRAPAPAPSSRPAAPAAATAPAAPDPKRALRRAIAAAMSRSKREIPHYYLSASIDLGNALTWLAARNANVGIRERVLPGVLLMKAVALAARRMPDFNARFERDELQPSPEVNLGTAIALRGGGLVAPAIHRADTLELGQLMQKLDDLVARARGGSLRSSELSDGTITVTSLGERGVESVFPIIYPPQTAIVGFGRIADRPWVVGGALAVRPIVVATLGADHRVTDGHAGARFLSQIDELLQEPERL